jgi:hypothetical protein
MVLWCILGPDVALSEILGQRIVIASEPVLSEVEGAKQSQTFRRLFLPVGREIATALRASQ